MPLYPMQWGATLKQKTELKNQALEILRARGGARRPQPVAGMNVAACPEGLLVTWERNSANPPTVFYRVYVGTESNLFTEIHDPNCRQCVIPKTALDTANAPVNVFVTCFNGTSESACTLRTFTPGQLNLDHDVKDGASYRRVGSGYVDTSNRVVNVRRSGAGYDVAGDNLAMSSEASFGKNMIPNPGFESNLLNAPVNTEIAEGQFLCDGWQVEHKQSYVSIMRNDTYSRSGSHVLQIRIAPGTTVPTGYSESSVICTQTVPVSVGDIVRISGYRQWVANNTPVAGLTITQSLDLCLYASDGTFLGVIRAAANNSPGSFTLLQASLQIPATLNGQTPAYGRFRCVLYIQNNTGSVWYPASYEFAIMGFDDLKAVTQNTAFDLTPLNTMCVDTSAGSILSQSGTSSTVNVAAFTMQYGDGQISYNSGTVNCPSNSGTYFIYFDDPTYSGGAVSYQYTTSAATLTSANGRVLIGKIALSAGGGATGGGGGGGTGGHCFTGNVLVLTPNGAMRMDQLWPGNKVFTSGGPRPIKEVLKHEFSGELCRIGPEQGVTPEHHLLENGEWRPASEKFPERFQFTGYVYNLHIDSPDPNEHNYVLDCGEIAHNFLKTT